MTNELSPLYGSKLQFRFLLPDRSRAKSVAAMLKKRDLQSAFDIVISPTGRKVVRVTALGLTDDDDPVWFASIARDHRGFYEGSRWASKDAVHAATTTATTQSEVAPARVGLRVTRPGSTYAHA